MSETGPRPTRWDLAVYAGWAAAAYRLKRHYAAATAGELDWILAPTAWLVETLSGASFPFERGVGYVSHATHTAIVPGCAGVNFLLIASAVLVLGSTHRVPGAAGKLRWLATSSLLAFAAALCANTLRIVLDLKWRAAAPGLADHGTVHRLIGVGAYLVGALLVHRVGRELTPRTARRPRGVRGSIAWPLGCYLVGALGVPLLHGAYRRDGFAEHAWLVLGAAGALALLATLGAALLARRDRAA